MNLSLKSFKHLSRFHLIVYLALLSIIVRFTVFRTYYVFSNDDLHYFDWVKVLLGEGGFDLIDSPIFPPGYPAMLMFETWIAGSLYFAKMFEQVILMTAIPVLVLMVLQRIVPKVDLMFVFVIFTAPFMFIGMSTINISSEIWYTIIVLAGLINLLEINESNFFRKLLYSSILFSAAYLIRPEALVYFASWIFALRHWLVTYHQSLRPILKKSLLLLIPPTATVLSLSAFLTNYYGQVMLTGKLKTNYEFSREISESTLVRVFENSIGLLRVIIAPKFFGPAIVSLAVLGFFNILLKRVKLDNKTLIVFTPSILIILVLLILYPMGRPLIPSIATIVILSHFGWERIKLISHNGRGLLQKNILATVLITQTLFPYFGHQLSDSTKGYYEAINGIRGNSNLIVYSRETTLALLDGKFQYCSVSVSCQDAPDYLLLSDSTRAKLEVMNEIEASGVFPESVTLYGAEYHKVATSVGPYHKVYTYKVVN